MSQIESNSFANRFLRSASNAWGNYPVTMLATLVTVALVIYAIELPNDGHNNGGYWVYQAFNSWSVVTLSLATVLWVRQNNKSDTWLYVGYALSVAIPPSLALVIDVNKVSQLNAYPVHINIIGHLLVALACYKKPDEEAKFWAFNTGLFLFFIWSSAMAFILNSGISLAIVAVRALFDIAFDDKLFAYVAIFAGLVFQPHFFLGNLDSNWFKNIDETPEVGKPYPKFLRILVQFILLPIISLYILILYAYGFKAVFVETPKGYLTYLILALGVVGILTLLIGYPLRKQVNEAWFRIWDKIYYYIMIPILGLMGWAAWLRIAPYGLTAPRLLLIYTMAWLILVVGYMITSRKWGIRFIPLSLAAFVFLAMAGPVSVYSLAAYNQQARAADVMTRYNLKPGSDASKIKAEDRQKLASALVYLAESDVWTVGDHQFKSVVQKHTYGTERADFMLSQLKLEYKDRELDIVDKTDHKKRADFRKIELHVQGADSSFRPVPQGATGSKVFNIYYKYTSIETDLNAVIYIKPNFELDEAAEKPKDALWSISVAQLKDISKSANATDSNPVQSDKLTFNFVHSGNHYAIAFDNISVESVNNGQFLFYYKGTIYQLK